MLTKRDIVAQIQAAANYHLGHSALKFDTFVRKTKCELVIKLVIADKMMALDKQYYALQAKYTQRQLDAARIAPRQYEGQQILEDIKEMDRLRLESGNLWMTI